MFNKFGIVIMSTKKYADLLGNAALSGYTQGYKTGVKNGKAEAMSARVTPNELRKVLGLEPIEGGNCDVQQIHND
jgi:hypothetical protein